jgi:hypothetical protein
MSVGCASEANTESDGDAAGPVGNGPFTPGVGGGDTLFPEGGGGDGGAPGGDKDSAEGSGEDGGSGESVTDGGGTTEGDPDGGPNELDAEGGSTGPDTADGGEELDSGSPDTDPSDSNEEPVVPTALAVEVQSEAEDVFWAAVWRARVEHPALRDNPHAANTAHTDPSIVEHFGGSDQPDEESFLLHAAAGWDEPGRPVVLLVHGSGGDADLAFADLLAVPGMATALSNAGFSVFAITFPHPFGDVQNQAVQAAAALQLARVKAKSPKGSFVAHSKGGIAVAAYLNDTFAGDGLAYAGEVEHVVFLGTPLGGMDYTFRHPTSGAQASFWGLPVPTPWEKTYVGLFETDWFDESIYHPGYLGLQQLLAPWDEVYPLSAFEQDWYTTYYGGQGFVSYSRGIEATIELGENFMQKLWENPLPAEINAHIAAGANAFIGAVAWENTGPSDGLVFVDSATDLRLFEPDASVTVETFTLSNHPGLVQGFDVQQWVSEQLGGPFPVE